MHGGRIIKHSTDEARLHLLNDWVAVAVRQTTNIVETTESDAIREAIETRLRPVFEQLAVELDYLAFLNRMERSTGGER